MSIKNITNNSKEYNYNKSPHIYSYKYSWINHFIHFLLNAFMKKSMFPFISIGLYIIVIVLNTIQYNNNNPKYLQDQIKHTVSTDKDSTSPQNALLYFYDLIGINGFIVNGLWYILYFILTYTCLALIEMNIGHIKIVFFLIVLLMFRFFITGLSMTVCKNSLSECRDIKNAPYCCGSFIMWASLGFTLFIIQKHVSDFYTKMYVWFLIACVWAGCVLIDNYYSYADEETSNQKNCKLFFYHVANYTLGIFCGLVLSK